MKNYYTIMGISAQATSDEIKNAYRDLAFMYHPDRHRSSPERVQARAEVMMQALNEAYEILSKPEQRSAFDQRLARLEQALQNAGSAANKTGMGEHPRAAGGAMWSYDNYRNSPDPLNINPQELVIYVEWNTALPMRTLRFHNPNPETTDLDDGGHPSWIQVSWQGARRLRSGQSVELKVGITQLAWQLEEPYLTSDLLIDSSLHAHPFRIPVRVTMAERG